MQGRIACQSFCVCLCALEVVVTAEEEKKRDPDGYAAIRAIHGQMDDDKSGSIDRAESADVSVKRKLLAKTLV